MTPPSSRRLDRLPAPGPLERITRALATLDAALCEDWQYRFFSFQRSWDPGREERMASLRDGSGSDWFLVFSPAGAFLKGFALHSPMARAADAASFTRDLPEAFAHSAREPAFSMERTTFLFWSTGGPWQRSAVAMPEGPDPDGSEELLWLLAGRPEDYARFAEEYFEVSVPLDAVRDVYAHRPMTDALLGRLGAQRDLAAMREDLDEIGYPVAPSR